MRVRRLPLVARIVLGVAVVAGYTALAVALFAGGDDASTPSGPEPVARNELERRVVALIESGPDGRATGGDVVDFRRPRVRRVRCEGTLLCEVHYAVGVPGTGRIFEQQAPILRAVLSKTGVTELRINVVRGGPRETGVPAKEEEETITDAPLLSTTCDRRTVTDAQLRDLPVKLLLLRLCKITETGEAGGRSSNPGKGSGGDGILETGKP